VRILWVKGGGLVPPDVGLRIRSYYLLRELAKRHQITLFTFYAAHPDDEHETLKSIFERVVCLPLDVPARRSRQEYLSFFRHLLSATPYSINKYCRPEVGRVLRQSIRGQQYDAAICDFILAAAVFPWTMPCPKIIFTHNVEALIWRRHVEVAENPLWKWVARREYHTMARFERRYLAQADHVLAVSKKDREFLSTWVEPGKITVIPTGVDTDFFSPALVADEHPDSLVFSGAMDWIPNEEGMMFFMEQILPLIRREIPGTTLKIVGRNPSEKLRLAARQHAVEVTGRVDDVRPHVRGCGVYVVPLRVGSGTRLKIFEAMAMGKAMVSTSLGAEGLPVADGENILLADEPQEFAHKTAWLLRNPAERARLGAAGRKLVAQYYSWATVSLYFDEMFSQLIGNRRAQQPLQLAR